MADIATFGPASLAAQLAELQRERAMRHKVYPHMIASGKLDRDKADHNNRGLDGAIKTLETLIAASGQPGRRELVDALRKLAEHADGMESQHPDYHHLAEGGVPCRSAPLADAMALLARIPA